MSQAIVAIKSTEWTPEQLALIKSTVAKGATNDELKLFLYRCQVMGLDPLKPGQIHFVKYGSNPGSVVVGIEGFRAKAARTGKHDGTRREVIKDKDGKILGAWAEVWRKDASHPFREEVPFDEYDTGRASWAKMPETMIKKVAEAAALRMAFPDDLGGLYTPEEMEQAKSDLPAVYPDQPEEGDGSPHATDKYLIPGGTYAKRSLEEVDPAGLRQYIERGEVRIAKDPSKKPAWWDDFVRRAEDYLGSLENTPIEEVLNGSAQA